MIQELSTVTLKWASKVNTLTLQTDSIFGQIINGEVDEDIEFTLTEQHEDRRKRINLPNIQLDPASSYAIADFLAATDKFIEIDSVEYDVVGEKANYDKYFELVKKSNVRVTIDLKFIERDHA
jgi:hypothetical protein